VHESTTFIALALFMKSYRFDKKIFLQIYFGMHGLYVDKFSCFNTFHHCPTAIRLIRLEKINNHNDYFFYFSSIDEYFLKK
jgi:hypothetical protein